MKRLCTSVPTRTALALLCGSSTLLPLAAHAAPVVESLSRGVVAVHQPDGRVFVSWRLLASDPDGVAFNVYRETAPLRVPTPPGGNPATRMQEESVVKLNAEPLAGPTWFLDTGAELDRETKYHVRTVVGGVEGEPSKRFALPAG